MEFLGFLVMEEARRVEFWVVVEQIFIKLQLALL